MAGMGLTGASLGCGSASVGLESSVKDKACPLNQPVVDELTSW